MTSSTHFEGREEQSANYEVSSRRWLAKGSDVYVKEFTLAANEGVPLHSHTTVFDIFYVIEGKLSIECVDVATGENLPTIELAVGDSTKITVETAHRPFNHGPGVCRFVIIQGVGEYDFLPFNKI
jgi:mannose-6-phosphate isomerase-like protein (cupin superfamily)